MRLDWNNILNTGDGSTFVPRGSDKKEGQGVKASGAEKSLNPWRQSSPLKGTPSSSKGINL